MLAVALEYAALEYAARGWPVFPLKGKEPMTSNGVKDATTDEDQIREWWMAHPLANIGLATGEASAVVLDFDGAEERAIIEAHVKAEGVTTAEDDLNTIRVKTRKGAHLYFAWSDGCEKLRNWTDVIGSLDIRTTGGYVVAPPSIHPDTGEPYTWIVSPKKGELKPFPGWLIDLLLGAKAKKRAEKLEGITEKANKQKVARTKADEGHPYGRAALEDEIATLRATHEGERNSQLNTSAIKLFGLVKGGWLDRGEVERGLTRAAKSTGLKPAEIKATLQSAYDGATARDLPDDSRRDPEPGEDVPEDIKAKARAIMESGDPVKYILDVVERFHAGDGQSAELLLCSTAIGSILNTYGTQPKLSGGSGKGKSHLAKALRHVMPPEWIMYTALSPKALYRATEPNSPVQILPGMVIFSDDVRISEEMEDTLKRSMSNFQEPSPYLVVGKDQGLRNLHLPERLIWWLTSVSDDQEEQLINRFFSVGVDEGRDQDLASLDLSFAPLAEGRAEFPVTEDVLVCREIIRAIKSKRWTVWAPFLRAEDGSLN